MHDVIAQILTYGRGVWRNRWVIIGVAWLVSIVGWAWVLQLPDQYKASARVYVDTQSMLRPLLRGLAIGSNVNAQVAIITKTLLSRPNLEKVARMTDLDLKAKDQPKMEALIDDLRDNISISRTRRENLYTISVEDSDPKIAKKVVQSLLTIFVESSLGESRKDTDSATRFVDAQIKEYEAKLRAAENRLQEFKKKNVGMMPRDGSTYYNRLQSAISASEKARLELREAVNRRDEIKRQLSGEEPGLVMSGRGSVGNANSARIQALQTKMDDLLLQYTEAHPDVRAIKNKIRRIKSGQDKVDPIISGGDLETNPVYQQLKISLGQAEADVASLKVRVEEFDKRVDEMKKKVDTVPEIEAQLKDLDRDYGIHKKNYMTLMSRREAASIGQEAEESTDNVKFKVIDPPHVPSHPSGPNRPLLMSGVLGAGLAIGIGISFLLYMLRPTFDTRRMLNDITGLPVLGSVSMIWSPAQIQERRMKIIMFGGAGLVLIALYGIVVSYLLIVR